MQPIEVQRVIVVVLVFLDHPRQSQTQDVTFPGLPLGQFRFVTIPIGFNPMSSTTNQLSQSSNVLDRPRSDTSLPVGVDAAEIAAQEAAIVAFINACPRQMSLAGLRCPCSNPGGRCLDDYSLCSVDNKCVCNGRLSYPDPSGKRCIPYATSTTKLPTTRTSTTTSTAKPATTTTTTTTTTSTTTLTTTTTKPTQIFKDCSGGVRPNQIVRTLAISDIFEISSENYPSSTSKTPFTCSYNFKPPSGKRLKLDFEALDITSVTPSSCSSLVSLVNTLQFFCNLQPPLPTYTFLPDFAPGISVFIRSNNVVPYKYKIRVSVV